MIGRRDAMKAILGGIAGVVVGGYAPQAHATKEPAISSELEEKAREIARVYTIISEDGKRKMPFGAGFVLEDLFITAYHVWDASFPWSDGSVYLDDIPLKCIGTNEKSDTAVFQIPKKSEQIHTKYSINTNTSIRRYQFVTGFCPVESSFEKGVFKKGLVLDSGVSFEDEEGNSYKNMTSASHLFIPGDSGSPIFEEETNEVVGIVTHTTAFSPLENLRYMRG